MSKFHIVIRDSELKQVREHTL